MTDDHFADLLRQVGVVDAEKLKAYSAVVTVHAKSADPVQAVRLVELAHGQPIDRGRDEWFWRPFRDSDATFPVADGVEMHSRLADSCLRERFASGRVIDAMLVRLAGLVGWRPTTDLLYPAAETALARAAASPAPPSAIGATPKAWTEQEQKAIEALEPTTPLPQNLVTLGTAIGGRVDQVAATLRLRTEEVLKWAVAAHAVLLREQNVTQWLIAGVRFDGMPWEDLDVVTVAVDSAAELAAVVGIPPRNTDEQLLALVLRASHPNGEAGSSAAPTRVSTLAPVPPPLAALAPIHVQLASGGDLPVVTPAELATRVLWETATLTEWSRAS